MKKRRPKPTMPPAQALAAMRAQAVSREALRRGDERMKQEQDKCEKSSKR
jgi:hypothetical protein